MNLWSGPGRDWKLHPFPDSDFALFFVKPPNRFHRWMQKILFGFRWEKV